MPRCASQLAVAPRDGVVLGQDVALDLDHARRRHAGCAVGRVMPMRVVVHMAVRRAVGVRVGVPRLVGVVVMRGVRVAVRMAVRGAVGVRVHMAGRALDMDFVVIRSRRSST